MHAANTSTSTHATSHNVNTSPQAAQNAVCQNNDIWFTDIPAMVQGKFETASGPGTGWYSFEYELEHTKGIGLMTGARSPAAELVLHLGLTGTHILHIGQNPNLRVWLDGDTGYCELPGNRSCVTDNALPAMDLTGKNLHIAPVRSSFDASEVTLFYIRAEPCSTPPKQHKNLIITNDGHGVFCKGLDGPDDLYKHLYPFKNSDVFRIIWGTYGGSVLTADPKSKYNDLLSRNNDQAFYHRDSIYNDSLKKFVDQHADPLAVVRKITREYGLELHYYIRMSAHYGPFPHIEWTTQFFKDNPQLRCKTEQGDFVNILSYAYKEVQDYMLGFFEELLAYQPDGLCLAFNRGLPLMICEQPVLDAYKARYGRYPSLPEDCDSPQMLELRNDLLMQFIQRVRQLTDKHNKALSCIVPRDFEHNKLMGLDVQKLADQKLFESIMIGAGHGDDPALNADFEPVIKLKNVETKIYAGGSSSRAHGMAWDPNNLQARAQHMANIHDANLDGGWVWDAEAHNLYDMHSLRQFGNRQKLDQIIQGTWPDLKKHQTRKIHDLVVGRYNPWHAY